MENIQKWMESEHMLKKGEKLIAGVSGGADSVCLFFQLLEFCTTHENSLEVVHVEHGIRGKDSKEDAAFVENLCREHQIPFHLYCYSVKELAVTWKMTEEEAGRRARYEAFDDACKKYLADKIAVAHNLDDQAETILFHLVRGSGIRGLGGMEPVRGRIIRPLLRTSRREIEEYLRARGITWCMDSTNLETEYARNRIRLKIMPEITESLNRRAAEHIVAAGEKLRKADAYLVSQTKKLKERICIEVSDAQGSLVEVKIQRKELLQEEELMQEYLMKYCLEQFPQGQKDIGEVHIKTLCVLAGLENGKACSLPGGLYVVNQNEYLTILKKETEKQEKEHALTLADDGTFSWNGWFIKTEKIPYTNEKIPQNEYTKWLDYDTIKGKIEIRFRRAGDYISIREGESKSLKKYLIDEKIIRQDRDQIPLIADGSHILWVTGHRISAACKITEKTKTILKIHIEKENGKNGRQDSSITE